MSDHLRHSFARSMDQAISRQITEAMQQVGHALPCTITSVQGPVVTVQIDIQDGVHTFPPITLPVHSSFYVREPYRAGDTGVVIPMGPYIGNVSDLGGGQSNGHLQANLSSLVFLPVGRKSWAPVDGGKVVILGPTGTQIGEINGACTLIATASGFALTTGDVTVTTGDVIADMIHLKTHKHSAVQTGFDESGPPVPGS